MNAAEIFTVIFFVAYSGVLAWLVRRLTICRRPHRCYRQHYPIRLRPPAGKPPAGPARGGGGPRSPLSVRHVPAFLPATTAVREKETKACIRQLVEEAGRVPS